MSAHALNAINAARRVKSHQTTEDKLDELAKAIEAVGFALRDIEKRLEQR